MITMEGKGKIAVVGVIAVIIIAAVAVMFLNGNNTDEGDRKDGVEFLIQDNTGVYFWVEGSGDTVMDAYKDAMKDYGIPYVASQSKGEDAGISSMFGLEMKQVSASEWNWWNQYTYKDGQWVELQSYMKDLDSKSDKHIALVYGDGTVEPKVIPNNAKAWNHSTDGTVFTIQSSSGLYFQINGVGNTVMDAYKDAMKDYGIPYVASQSKGEDAGISSMYGLEIEQTSTGDWMYWNQKSYNGEGWEDLNSYMNSISSKDYKNVALVYGDGEVDPLFKP